MQDDHDGTSRSGRRSGAAEPWRSIEERDGGAAPGAEEGGARLPRRDFMKLMGASLAAAGMVGCDGPPQETMHPYVRQPERLGAGDPQFYATALPLHDYHLGVLVESRMGRPGKVEGNPLHPASLGATDIFAQASVLELWDPERSRTVLHAGEADTWPRFLAYLQRRAETFDSNGGAGLRFLTGALTSPTLAALFDQVLSRWPQARWHVHQAVGEGNREAGAELAFGRVVTTRYRPQQADVICALDGDLFGEPCGLRHARAWAQRRRVDRDAPAMVRLYAAEAAPSLTGAVADHTLPIRSSDVLPLTRAIAGRLGVAAEAPLPEGIDRAVVLALVDDLRRHPGRSLVFTGERQPAEVHALVHLINHELGNVGTTVLHTERVRHDPGSGGASSVGALEADMAAGRVDTLIMLGVNPVYDAAADLRFAPRLREVEHTIHMDLYPNETAQASRWHLPQAHPLESWGDGRALDGTASIRQPLIAPLFQGRTPLHLLARLLGLPQDDDRARVRSYWRAARGDTGFAEFWDNALREGVVPGTRAAVVTELVPRRERIARAAAAGRRTAAAGLELGFIPDPTIYDGRWANNAWLQELPKPITKLTWDNAAYLSPATARALGVATEAVVRLRLRGVSLEVPVFVVPGHAERTVTLQLGYGRRAGTGLAAGRGYDAYRLRFSDALWFSDGVVLEKTGRRYPLASAQLHHRMEGRHIVRFASRAEFRRNPGFVHAHGKAPESSLYPPFAYDGYKWGMSVNLNACIGCAACVVACQAENNIPTVGKEQVRRGREMHWLRIDRYYHGSEAAPRTFFQPVPCMQCEKAPCEPVCPVEASIHDSEGINVQVYNRCVGTRFCSNNCPYKVRRFNFFQYADADPYQAARHNPEVTVRMRGVMEKCNYCLQRIANARQQAKIENRRIRDGEVLTACQAVCPSGAIVFGDLNDPEAKVVAKKSSPLDYALLAELNTRPRTTYLGKVLNPNPLLQEGTAGDGDAPPASGTDERPA